LRIVEEYNSDKLKLAKQILDGLVNDKCPNGLRVFLMESTDGFGRRRRLY